MNLRTLKPGEESSSPHSSEYRVPVRKSEAQLRYWIETGNPPCQLNEEEEEVETDRTISISESEASELQSMSSTSMMVNKKLATSINQLLDTGSSGSSVDTATYIRNNGNARKTGTVSVEKDPWAKNFANVENNRVSRSTNLKTSKISLNRSMESFRKTPVAENDIVLQKSVSILPAEVNIGGNDRSAEEIRREDNEISEQLKLSNLKESEVTFDSKESGIGSMPIGNMKMDKKTRECTSSDSLSAIVPVRKKSVNRMRKLYTGDNSLFDLISSVFRPVSKNRSLRYSLHPALSCNSTEGIKKRKFRPSLLTLPGSSKAKRKSRGLAGKISRARDKRRRQSVKNVSISLRNDDLLIHEEASAKIEDKAEDVCIDPEKEADVLQNESRPNSPVICEKIIKTPKSQSFVNSSSSLSSGDVSKIINEKSRGISGTSFNNSAKKKPRKPPDNAKNQTPRNRSSKKNFTGLKLTDSRGSVFTPDENASPETLETRMKNMMHAKKNLYATDLRSSGSAESPSNFNPSPTLVYNLIKKPATPRRSSKRLRNAAAHMSAKISACVQSNPVIILHDFLWLENFSDKLDKEICEKWIRKQSLSEASKSTTKKCKKLLDPKIPVTKKLKLENKAAPIIRSDEKKETRKAIFRNSFSSEDSLPYLKYDDCQEMKLTEGGNVTVTFKTANHDTNDSIFAISSSDEENIFEKLNSWSRSRSKKKRIKEKTATENNVADNFGENIISVEAVAQDSEISFRPVYKIVSSSSENDENSVNKHSQPTKPRKFKRKLPKRNEGKDSPDSGLTMRSTQDGCTDKSELPKNSDEKLEKQSQDVNKRLETSKGKQFLNGRGASKAAQSAVNNGPRNCRESRLRMKSKRKNLIFNAMNSDPWKNDEEENFVQIISENSKTSVKKISPEHGKNIPTKTTDNYSKKVNRTDNQRVVEPTIKLKESSRKERKKSPGKIFTTKYADSKDESEVLRSPDYKERSKTSDKSFGINALIGDDEEKTLHDESYIFDDEINFLSRNNAGSYFRASEEENYDESLNISSYKKSRSSPKSEITLRRNLDNHSKEKSLNKEKRSTIIFQTKEYWESDSDDS